LQNFFRISQQPKRFRKVKHRQELSEAGYSIDLGEGGRGKPPPLGAAPREGWAVSSKTDEKILGVWGVTSPIILEFQPEFVTSGFQRPDLTYVLCNIIVNLLYCILLNLFFVI